MPSSTRVKTLRRLRTVLPAVVLLLTVGAAGDGNTLASGPPLEHHAVQACRGRCVDPHPGQFRSWYGQRNGCWVQVWRQWPEGCTHYQLFNTCQNVWDVHPNGQAKVTWTCCVH